MPQKNEHHSTSSEPGLPITAQSPRNSASVTAATTATTERARAGVISTKNAAQIEGTTNSKLQMVAAVKNTIG